MKFITVVSQHVSLHSLKRIKFDFISKVHTSAPAQALIVNTMAMLNVYNWIHHFQFPLQFPRESVLNKSVPTTRSTLLSFEPFTNFYLLVEIRCKLLQTRNLQSFYVWTKIKRKIEKVATKTAGIQVTTVSTTSAR